MRRRYWVPVLLVTALGLGGWAMRSRGQGREAGRGRGAGRGEDGQGRPVLVIAASVARRDVPVVLEGIGTVAAFKTVTVRSRVDGLLDNVGFREGQDVKKGSLLAQIDPRPFQIQLHQAEAMLARDRAQLQGARLNLDRYVSVRSQNLIAQQQVDDQKAMVEQQEAGVRGDEAQVENARLQLEYARITSPIEGVTGVRLVDPGNMIHANDPGGIVMVTQLDPITVLFTLPQDDLARVSAEMQKGTLAVTAWSRDGGEELGQGALALIDNQINVGTGTIRLKAVFPNPKRRLWPNQFVKARLALTSRKGALVVPAVAIQRGPSGGFVFLVEGDTRVEMRPVEIDAVEGDTAIVARGLAEGDRVVIDGQSQLRPGAPVDVKPAPPASAIVGDGGSAGGAGGLRGGRSALP